MFSARREPSIANYTLTVVACRVDMSGTRMEKGLRVRGPGNVALRALDGRDGRGSAPVPGFIGDGERRYEIVREISRGGMGTVHLGRLRGPFGFAKNVAIKTMHARDVADPQIARIFAAEARLTAGLCHANIVSTLDVLVEQGSVFIVMEYIDGSSLSHLVALASDFGVLLPVEVSCAIMHDVLLGLEHAHNAGVIHCDISPQNILVGTDGLSRVVDFGIAKIASSARQSVPDTDNTEIRGKVPYMAPEQLRGGRMDHRVDLYAAGATLWELLTGVRLFRGTNRMQIAANVLTGSIEPPSRHLGEVPRALDAFVLKATQREPRMRFRSAREMANMLASSVPLASRQDVVASMRRLDMKGTPGSGIRALSPEEIAVRQHARAARERGEAAPPPPAPTPGTDPRRTTMSQVRREKARASLRVRLATVGLLGIALGAGQATFNVLPIDPYIERVLPSKPRAAAAAKPRSTTMPRSQATAQPAAAMATQAATQAAPQATTPAMPAPMVGAIALPVAPANAPASSEPLSKPRSDKPRGSRSDKPRR